jgi:septal ring factor EnvC (AmiA/AmiB activator)
LRQRQADTEARVGKLEVTVRTEAHLRATMDRDMSKLHAEFRAQRSMLQALHDTQQDHTRRLTRVEDRLTGVEDRLTGVEDRLTGVEDRLANVEGTLQLVRVGVETLHAKLDLLIATQ